MRRPVSSCYPTRETAGRERRKVALQGYSVTLAVCAAKVLHTSGHFHRAFIAPRYRARLEGVPDDRPRCRRRAFASWLPGSSWDRQACYKRGVGDRAGAGTWMRPARESWITPADKLPIFGNR
jgi:hypothetical protein